MRDKITDADVLLVVDVRNDFCPGGNLAVPRGDEVVPLVNQLGSRFQLVVLTQDWHPSGHLRRSRPAAFRDGRLRLRPAGVVAGPLRARHARRAIPCRLAAAQAIV
jgi:nicotinamidase-related amidase